MALATTKHLARDSVVPAREGRKMAAPAHRLGMVSVATRATRDDREDRVDLAMLAEEVLTAEPARIDVPDAH